MAPTRTLESRWVRRYRVFFILGCLIFSIQVFLAYKFFTGDVDGVDNIQNTKENDGKKSVEILSEDLNGGVSSRRFRESYLVVDDEDSPSNSNPVNGLYRKQKVPPDKFDFHSDVRSNTVMMGKVPERVNSKAAVLFASNLSVLRLEELDFVPVCDVSTKEAISAIRRAKTQQCKQEIVNVTCLIQQGQLYPSYLPNSCPSVGFTAGKSLGCFRDDKTFRLLSGYFANMKTTNSPQHCINMCLQSGFPYAGVQFATQCFCGNDEPPSTSRLPDSSCNMKCPADPKEACGGYFTINVYETGIAKFVPQVPRESSEKLENPVRVAFLLTLNGRALRQVHRLIKALFHVDHYFYIHVDARQDYLFRELLPLEEKFLNVRLARKRYATIWGGASLLQMLLSSMTELLRMDWQWDFVINLSESDFPVKTNVQLVEFLSANKDQNFVKSHGREVQRFIQKQGLDKTFVECDAHMWRTGDRRLPWGLQMDGGSDWVALSRPFVSYVAAAAVEDVNSIEDELLKGLRIVFKHTLLPAETFFHTVLRNSKFCRTYVDNNLHVTNWKRRLGCKCQYKHVVDWCGCSPNDFKMDDWSRLQGTEGRLLFFARKFEPIINQAVIDQVEEWLYGTYPSLPSLQSYWQNLYHHADLGPRADDALLTLASSFSRLASKRYSTSDLMIKPLKILEITSYHYKDSYSGTLVLFEANAGSLMVRMETMIQPRHFFSITKTSGIFSLLKSLGVSSDYDQKEQVSRNFASALGPLSEPVLIYNLQTSSNINSAPTGINVTLLWIDPAGQLADVTEFHLDASSNIGSVKPFLRDPLLPGVWEVKLVYNSSVIANTLFLITPLQFVNGAIISQQQSGMLRNVTFVSREPSDWDKFLANAVDASALQKKAVLNSQRFGVDLQEWIDSLSSRFYTVLDLCIVGPNSMAKEQEFSGLNISHCSKKKWSSVYPDPKSEITSINNTSGQLNRF